MYVVKGFHKNINTNFSYKFAQGQREEARIKLCKNDTLDAIRMARFQHRNCGFEELTYWIYTYRGVYDTASTVASNLHCTKRLLLN